jgi:enoyl-CoA hydratase/carnithine racemase
MNDPTVARAQVLRSEQHGSVRHLILDRPHQRNALNDRLIDGLAAALSAAEHDPSVTALMIRGAGPSFCAGADLQHLLALHDSGATPRAFLETVSALVRRIELSELPVVAVLHGHAVAGGLEIALACDVVVAEAGTLIGDGHIRNQLLPGAGSSVRLRRKVGDALGRWLILTGDLLPAERFLASGWLHAVSERGSGPADGQRLAGTLAASAGPAQSAAKQLLAQLDDHPGTDDGLRDELDAFARHWAAHDVPTALHRFFATRQSNPPTIQRHLA